MSKNLRFKIIIIGEFAVGKTSLIRNYIDKEFTEDYKATIGTNLFLKKMKVKDADVTITIWDLAGQTRFEKIRFAYYKGAQGVIAVGDLTRKSTFKRIEGFWLPDFRKNESIETPVIILANKEDLKPEIDDDALHEVAQRTNALSVIKTSAKTGTHVNEAFSRLLEKVIELNSKESE